MFSYLEPLRKMERPETVAFPALAAASVRPSVSIILPTLNEAENIDHTLGEIVAQVRDHFEFEIIVADGGSTDGTCEKVVIWQTDHPVSLIGNGRAGGLAKDVLSAAAQAKFSIVVVMDADGSHPASSIRQLVAPVASGRYDMAIGSRYVDGGTTNGWAAHRRVLSRLGAAFASPFTEIKDPLSGFFAIRRPCLLAAAGHTEGFKIGLEAIYAGSDRLDICEVPISFSERLHGSSKIGASQFIAYLEQLARFSGVATVPGSFQRFVLVGIAGFFLDLLVVSFAQALGAGIMVAHVSGFCVATVCNYFGHASFSFADRPKDTMQLVRFIVIAVMALAMRGGFIATTSELGLPMLAVVSAGIIGGGVISYIGNEFYVFRGSAVPAPSIQWKMATIGLVAYVVVLRLLYQGAIDVIPQEAYYWTYAQHPAWGYLDHPPMVAWLISFGTMLFGDTEFGVRAGATMSWLVTAYFMYRFTSDLFGRMSAFLALLLLSVLPFFFAIGALTTPDAPLTAAWSAALYFLHRAVVVDRPKAWLGAGVAIGLGMLSKYTIALLGPAALVFLIVDPGSRRWLSTKWPYICAGVAATLFSPVIAWNAGHDWASFQFQGAKRWISDEINFSTPTFLMFVAMLLGPLGLLLAGAATDRIVRISDRIDMRRTNAFLTAFTVVPLAVFTVFSLFHTVKMNWTGPVWLSLLPVMAKVVATAVKDGSMPRLVAAVKIGAVSSILAFALLLHYLALGLPFIGYSSSLRSLPVAWKEFVSAAEQIKAKVAAETGYLPMLVGMDSYSIASELGFYRSGRTALSDITSQNLFGQDGLMFGIWGSARPYEGRVAIMYGLKEESISDDNIAAWFDSIGPVERRIVQKNQTSAGRFFYRIGYGLRSGPAPSAR
jgi:dolichol-phosphate mannosyltransferase